MEWIITQSLLFHCWGHFRRKNAATHSIDGTVGPREVQMAEHVGLCEEIEEVVDVVFERVARQIEIGQRLAHELVDSEGVGEHVNTFAGQGAVGEVEVGQALGLPAYGVADVKGTWNTTLLVSYPKRNECN